MTIDETRCPLCGSANACGAHDATPCWCFNTVIPQGSLDQVPADKQMKACICQACVTRYQQAQQQ